MKSRKAPSQSVITRMRGRPIADAMLTLRLPREDLVWLKVYAAQQGEPMTAILQRIIHDLRNGDVHGMLGTDHQPTTSAVLTVRLPREDLVWLKVYAAQQRKSMTAILQRIIRDWRNRYFHGILETAPSSSKMAHEIQGKASSSRRIS